MKKLNLREHVRDYYKSQQLSETALERLLDMGDVRQPQLGNRWKKWTVIAATLCLASIVGFILLHRGEQTNSTAQNVAEEIALKHSMKLLPKLVTTDYQELGRMMERLDFQPVNSHRVQRSGLRLIGGLYCSLKGQIAAQIKLRDADGELVTLYQTRDSTTFKSLTESRIEIDGVEVIQWREQGVYMGLAR